MNTIRQTLMALLVMLTCFMAPAQAAGLLKAIGQQSTLEISSHHVDVVIENGFAITSIEQVFSNSGQTDDEAIYSFPVPRDASVGEFTYWVDGQPIHGEVLEKKQAKQIYEQEKQAGKEAALVEKNDYKTFEILVTPVRAHQSVRIKLVYLQPVPVDMGIGRYVYPLEDGGVDEAAKSFWNQNENVKDSFQFNIRVRSAYPVDGLRFASHQNAAVQKNNFGEWTGKIAEGNARNDNMQQAMAEIEAENGLSEGHEQSSLNPQVSQHIASRLDKDVVVYWRHQPGLPGAVDLVTFKEEGQRRGTFSVVITPGEELAKIETGADWIFVIDISGSMQGKLATLVDGVSQAIDKLRHDDRFKLIVFNNNAREITSGYTAATPENKAEFKRRVAKLSANSGTNLYAGLKQALWKTDEDRTSAIILVTDGVANVGKTEKKQFFELLENKDIRLFTFVMGNSANRPLLEGLAKYSNGFSQSISNSDDILGQIMWAVEKVGYQALHDIEVKVNGVKVKDLSPENIGSIYRGQQIMLYGHYFGEGDAELTVSGKISGQKKSWRTQVNFPKVNTTHPELERLWAYATIKDLEAEMDKLGPDQDAKDAIKDIALNYGLVTGQTSMLVVREEVFANHNIQRTNKARIAKEQQARAQRSQQPKAANTAVQQASSAGSNNNTTPMYSKPRPAFSGGNGGGSFGMIMLLVMLPLLFFRSNRNQQ